MSATKRVLFVMGVSGTGKTTIGKLLASSLSVPFFDGDDFHPKENIEKMASGKPLDDHDREGWLKTLNELAKKHSVAGCTIACSALKRSYRRLLSKDIEHLVEFVYLKGTLEEVSSRLEKRSGHFMPKSLLQSQFETLEPPTDGITVSIALSPEQIVERVLLQLNGSD